MTGALRIGIVDDHPLFREGLKTLLAALEPGVRISDAGSVAEAVAPSGEDAPDLILLDMNLPDGHGLDLLQRIRHDGHLSDVIAVTSARDLAVVRSSVSLGIVQYLLKPFVFAALRDKLERYAEYVERVRAEDVAGGQAEVDRAFAALRGSGTAPLPKGMSSETLDAVLQVVRGAGTQQSGFSASEVAERVGASRVTARRYLEFLADNGTLLRAQRYGGAGRPEVEYRWSG